MLICVALEGVQERVEDVSSDVNKLVRSQHDQESQVMLDWLTPVNMALQHNDFISRRHPGTGQWFLESAKYQAWVSGDRQTLYCPGIPGAGKTMIAAIVINHLQEQFRNDQSIGIAYLYCNFRRQQEQKAEDLLANLLKQLAKKESSLLQIVKDLYGRHKNHQTRPLLNEIADALHVVATKSTKVFIVVDALDECEGYSRDRMLKEILAVQARTKTSINIFATSRIDDTARTYFAGYPSQEISAADNDIREFVATKVQALQSDLSDAGIREEIQSRVVETAKGMYVCLPYCMPKLAKPLTQLAGSCLSNYK